MESSVENLENTDKKSGVARLVATLIIIALFILLFAASFSMKETPARKVWNPEMTVGRENASRFYVMYTDLMCPYCDVFSRAALEHWDDFTSYLDEHNILFELRLTDALYAGGSSTYSRDAAEAAYCAKRENKFWDFYHGAIESLWKDYQSKGIGSNKSAAPITNLPDDYWLKIGHQAGLSETFDNCVKNRETAEEVVEYTNKALQDSEGMPTFKFEKFTTSGFSDTWGWDYVVRYLDAGL